MVMTSLRVYRDVTGQWLEDPYLWRDKRDHWHLLQHAFDVSETRNCLSKIQRPRCHQYVQIYTQHGILEEGWVAFAQSKRANE